MLPSPAAVYSPFDPAAITLPVKENWCITHVSSCTLICKDEYGDSTETLQNDCDPASLSWACVCQGDRTPDLAVYSLTVPYFECVQVVQDCILACPPGGNSCAAACNAQKSCGAASPKTTSNSTLNATLPSPSATSSAPDAAYTGFGTTSKSSTHSASAARPTPRLALLALLMAYIAANLLV
ncbi:hypothetical protein NEOLI_004622 [Neolecta irregularis DAH-3]|uniref:DUF7707 domain-containing protein n=1 Tax=Neolecta irregularis (strain DAH-3) TaxID=1198029 RepID=A0A1U7LKN7_NEOID|nr:hypothetical protein NEOLI_004622 [Neolecta irregularis DAH-3]|eukprot:OLL23220.1 hypothetical protein NEOLI_004622 [Neolecta irregularis DAH-3]